MNRITNARLIQQIAEEAQLLAEEKWIIDSLRKIRQQRNSLQIESLHIENLKLTVGKNHKIKNIKPEHDAAVVPLLQKKPKQKDTGEQNVPIVNLSQFDVPVGGIDDALCNTQELNLSVTHSVFANPDLMNSFIIEEDDEDLENDFEDDEDMENCLIEMNMLMQNNDY